MKHISLIISLIFSLQISPLVAQVLYLKNGEQIPYDRISINNNTKIATITSKEQKDKLELSVADIEKILSGNVMEYTRPFATDGDSRLYTMPRIIEGKINVYRYGTYSSDSYGGGTSYYLFLEKGQEFEFSGGFTELHTRSYEEILKGNGFGLSESKRAIQIVHEIRNIEPIGLVGSFHDLAKLPLDKHPFQI